MKFIFVGIVVAILGVVTIAIPFDGRGQIDRFNAGAQFSGRIWAELSARHIGPIPFPVAALGAILALNGIGLKSGLTGKRLIGANLFMIACLVGLLCPIVDDLTADVITSGASLFSYLRDRKALFG